MVSGIIKRSKGVAVGAVYLHKPVKFRPRNLFGAAEHQMFKQMRRTALARLFIDRPYPVPHHMFGDRRLVVFHHQQPGTV